MEIVAEKIMEDPVTEMAKEMEKILAKKVVEEILRRVWWRLWSRWRRWKEGEDCVGEYLSGMEERGYHRGDCGGRGDQIEDCGRGGVGRRGVGEGGRGGGGCDLGRYCETKQLEYNRGKVEMRVEIKEKENKKDSPF